MTLVPLYAVPGICKVNSSYASGEQSGFGPGRVARGRITDMKNVRIVAGFPEKIGGYTSATSSTMTGVPRGFRTWRDNSSNDRAGIGTHLKLYIYDGVNLTDITPFRGTVTGSLTNPFTTTATSKTVTVAHTSHGLSTGDYVQLTAGAAVGGITIAGTFDPITKVDANSYTIVNPTAASGSVSGGGGTVTYTYYRKTLGSSPFSTTSGSPTVTVTDNSHGAVNNDFVTFAGAIAVAGLTLNGEFQISGVTTNTYTITAGSNANATTTGGGTPTAQYDINTGAKDNAQVFGYSSGQYSTPNGYSLAGSTSTPVFARTWSLHSYGQQLLCGPSGGSIYVYDPSIGGRAYPLYNAPSTMQEFFITPERFVIELGTSNNLMQIAWPDQNDDTVVTASATNTANSGRVLNGGSYLVNGIVVRDGLSLIFSNTSVFTHSYTGDNNVYADNLIGSGAGLISTLAVVEYGGIVYWMSDHDFFMWNGTIQKMNTDDIRDFVFGTPTMPGLNTGQTNKFWAITIRAKATIRWYYCSATSTEIDSYIDYHVDQDCWSIGSLTFTSGVDGTLFPFPMVTDASGAIYNLESGVDANGSALDAYFVVSPMDISNGDRSMDVMGFIVDTQRQVGNLSLSILVRDYPDDTDSIDGPYTVGDSDKNPLVDTRISGKMAGYKIESNVLGGDFRIGLCRAEIAPAGARR